MCLIVCMFVRVCLPACVYVCVCACLINMCLIVCVCACVSVQGDMSNVTIRWLQWGPVHIYNTTLICEAAAAGSPPAPPITLVAETAQQLLLGIQLLGQLQPSTIILAHDMSVPADGSWPAGLLVNQSMVLTGQLHSGRTVLDMYQVGNRPAGHGWV